MLLRFLTLATASVTYLSMQALSSTETKSQRLSATSAFSTANIIDLPTSKQLLLQAKFQATQSAFPPLPKSLKIQRIKRKSKQKLSKIKKTRIIKRRKVRAKQKKFIRLAYMPPSHQPQVKQKSAKKEKVIASLTSQQQAAKKIIKRGPKPKYSLGARVKVKLKKRPQTKTAARRKARYKRKAQRRHFGLKIYQNPFQQRL